MLKRGHPNIDDCPQRPPGCDPRASAAQVSILQLAPGPNARYSGTVFQPLMTLCSQNSCHSDLATTLTACTVSNTIASLPTLAESTKPYPWLYTVMGYQFPSTTCTSGSGIMVSGSTIVLAIAYCDVNKPNQENAETKDPPTTISSQDGSSIGSMQDNVVFPEATWA